MAEGAYSGFNSEQASVVRQMSVPFEYFKAAGELPPRGSGFRADEAAAENTKSMLAAFAGSSGLSRLKCVLRRFFEDLGTDFRMLPEQVLFPFCLYLAGLLCDGREDLNYGLNCFMGTKQLNN